MRKRTSFLATTSTVPFSHGKDPHTFKVLRISSAADGKQISLSHAQCAFFDATAWKCGCQLWNVTPHMLYPTWIFNAYMTSIRVDFEIFWNLFPCSLQANPVLETDQNPPRIIQEWTQPKSATGFQTNVFFLFWSWRGGCSISLVVLLEYKFLVSRGRVQWAFYQQLLRFLLRVKLPVKEGKSIDFTAELIDDASSPFLKLESSCSGCQGVLNPPRPLSCHRTLSCWLGQKLLATPVGFPVLGKSP